MTYTNFFQRTVQRFLVFTCLAACQAWAATVTFSQQSRRARC